MLPAFGGSNDCKQFEITCMIVTFGACQFVAKIPNGEPTLSLIMNEQSTNANL